MTSLRSGSASDVGKVRTTNQDVALEDPDLFAVADGMGGHVGGEVAARVAVDSLRAAFQRDPTVEGLRSAVAEANRAVWRQGQSESGLRGMGTTLTATALAEAEDGRQVIALANVGDSRAYVFSNDQVIQVTADHSLAEEKVRQGQLTEAEAAVHPHRHILTRALGVSSDVDVDLWELHLHDGDRILLCSDGLTNEIGDERIGKILAGVKEPAEAAKALVKAALDHGGSDNVTCIVIDVVGVEPPATAGDAADGVAGVAPAGMIAAGSAARAGVPGDRDDSVDAGPGPAANGEQATPVGAPDAASTRTLRAVGGAATRSSVRVGTNGPAARNGITDTAVVAAVGSAAVAGADGPTDASGTADGRISSGRPGRGAGNVLSAARLQARELRRLQPARDDRRHRRRSARGPRLITFRLVLFVLLVLVVVAAAYFLMRWYAMDDWYVGVDHGHLAVYQGRPDGFLWFKSQLVDDTPVTTSEVPTFTIPQVRRDHQEPSLAAAKSYVTNLHNEYCSTFAPTNGGASSACTGSGSTSTGAGSSSTTTSAFKTPVAAWQ